MNNLRFAGPYLVQSWETKDILAEYENIQDAVDHSKNEGHTGRVWGKFYRATAHVIGKIDGEYFNAYSPMFSCPYYK